jgi:8-oxo-dGTP diphosphatase
MSNTEFVYCAGGLVWQNNQVLLIQSREDHAWKLPKGHIDGDDPSWEHAAQREVKEETGYDTIITDFAGFTKYPLRQRTKVVLYWHMLPVGDWRFEPSDEIERCEWLPFRDAVDRLSYVNDKKFLLQFTDLIEKRDE